MSFKKITYFCLLLFLLLRPITLLADNDEPFRLPERVILGEDKAAKTTFSFTEESSPDTPYSTANPLFPSTLPSLSSSTFTLEAGTQDNLAASFSRQNVNWSLRIGITQKEIEPFPQSVKELIFCASRKKMTRFCLFDLSFSVGHLWNLPASERVGNVFLPANLSESGEAQITFSGKPSSAKALLTPSWTVTYLLLDKKDEGKDLTVIWPAFSGEVSLALRCTRKVQIDLFLDYQSDYQNKAVKNKEMLLPGVALSYRWLPNDLITIKVNNFTDQKYEILPGFYGPGSTAVLGYSHSF